MDGTTIERRAGTPDRRAALERAIERDRLELRGAIERLKAVASDRVHLGNRLRERPAAWLVGGFLVGFALGLRKELTRDR